MIGKIISMKNERAQFCKKHKLNETNYNGKPWAAGVNFETLPYVAPIRTNKAK